MMCILSQRQFLWLHIKPLYKKDKTKDKRNFKKQVSFIYFYANAKSDYMHVTHLPSRADKIMNDLDMLTNGEAVHI